ncbi:MAG: four helix bundle protein [Desulfobacca sp.]|uniref:four helix bundle protein n=1 Tax=Desulfobacca sp. TaxID=2067990 RepID=UPI00404ACA59
MRRIPPIETTSLSDDVFETAVQLFKDIYQLTDTWPRTQTFGLMMDIRRAAMNISNNLSEGQAQRQSPEWREFVTLSQEGVTELERHLQAAQAHPALDAAAIDPLLRRAADLRQGLQRLAATLS